MNAAYLDGKTDAVSEDIQLAFARLNDQIRTLPADGEQESLVQHARTFGTLSERMANLAVTLTRDIHSAKELCTTP